MTYRPSDAARRSAYEIAHRDPDDPRGSAVNPLPMLRVAAGPRPARRRAPKPSPAPTVVVPTRYTCPAHETRLPSPLAACSACVGERSAARARRAERRADGRYFDRLRRERR